MRSPPPRLRTDREANAPALDEYRLAPLRRVEDIGQMLSHLRAGVAFHMYIVQRIA